MTKRTIIAAGIALMLLAYGPALANAMGATLGSNTSYPSSGKYANMANQRVVLYNSATGVSQDGGPAAFGVPQDTPDCGASSTNPCENTDPSECVWTTTNKWSTSSETDIAYGQCVAVLVRKAGTDSAIAYRAAVRIAQSSIGSSEEWHAEVTLEWTKDTVTPAGAGWTVSVTQMRSESCIRDLPSAVYATTGLFFVDCVWDPSREERVTQHKASYIDPDGFNIRVTLFQNGVAQSETMITCDYCLL